MCEGSDDGCVVHPNNNSVIGPINSVADTGRGLCERVDVLTFQYAH